MVVTYDIVIIWQKSDTGNAIQYDPPSEFRYSVLSGYNFVKLFECNRYMTAAAQILY